MSNIDGMPSQDDIGLSSRKADLGSEATDTELVRTTSEASLSVFAKHESEYDPSAPVKFELKEHINTGQEIKTKKPGLFQRIKNIFVKKVKSEGPWWEEPDSDPYLQAYRELRSQKVSDSKVSKEETLKDNIEYLKSEGKSSQEILEVFKYTRNIYEVNLSKYAGDTLKDIQDEINKYNQAITYLEEIIEKEKSTDLPIVREKGKEPLIESEESVKLGKTITESITSLKVRPPGEGTSSDSKLDLIEDRFSILSDILEGYKNTNEEKWQIATAVFLNTPPEQWNEFHAVIDNTEEEDREEFTETALNLMQSLAPDKVSSFINSRIAYETASTETRDLAHLFENTIGSQALRWAFAQEGKEFAKTVLQPAMERITKEKEESFDINNETNLFLTELAEHTQELPEVLKEAFNTLHTQLEMHHPKMDSNFIVLRQYIINIIAPTLSHQNPEIFKDTQKKSRLKKVGARIKKSLSRSKKPKLYNESRALDIRNSLYDKVAQPNDTDRASLSQILTHLVKSPILIESKHVDVDTVVGVLRSNLQQTPLSDLIDIQANFNNLDEDTLSTLKDLPEAIDRQIYMITKQPESIIQKNTSPTAIGKDLSILYQNNALPLTTLQKILNSSEVKALNLDTVIQSFIKSLITDDKSKAVEFLKLQVNHEINMAHEVTTLLRGNSIFSKAFGFFMKETSQEFTNIVLNNVINGLERSDPIEIDPEKVIVEEGQDKNEIVQQNIENLSDQVNTYLNSVLENLVVLPSEVKEVITELGNNVNAKFPPDSTGESPKNFAQIQVNGQIFLRLLNPALMTFGITSPEYQRGLQLITSATQRVANQVYHSSKPGVINQQLNVMFDEYSSGEHSFLMNAISYGITKQDYLPLEKEEEVIESKIHIEDFEEVDLQSEPESEFDTVSVTSESSVLSDDDYIFESETMRGLPPELDFSEEELTATSLQGIVKQLGLHDKSIKELKLEHQSLLNAKEKMVREGISESDPRYGKIDILLEAVADQRKHLLAQYLRDYDSGKIPADEFDSDIYHEAALQEIESGSVHRREPTAEPVKSEKTQDPLDILTALEKELVPPLNLENTKDWRLEYYLEKGNITRSEQTLMVRDYHNRIKEIDDLEELIKLKNLVVEVNFRIDKDLLGTEKGDSLTTTYEAILRLVDAKINEFKAKGKTVSEEFVPAPKPTVDKGKEPAIEKTREEKLAEVKAKIQRLPRPKLQRLQTSYQSLMASTDNADRRAEIKVMLDMIDERLQKNLPEYKHSDYKISLTDDQLSSVFSKGLSPENIKKLQKCVQEYKKFISQPFSEAVGRERMKSSSFPIQGLGDDKVDYSEKWEQIKEDIKPFSSMIKTENKEKIRTILSKGTDDQKTVFNDLLKIVKRINYQNKIDATT